jgi:hypothetical protein
MDFLPLAVLLAVCFYLLVHWEKVKRPTCFLMGAAGLALALVGVVFAISGSTAKVAFILIWLGTLAAFVGLFGAAYPGALPAVVPGEQPAAAPPQAEE